MTYTTHSEHETKQIAARFASRLKGGEIIFLEGDLGSGKTTFVRGVADYFGFDQPVRSPSFTIVNRYLVEHKSIRQIFHVDFFRIEHPSQIAPLALEEEVGASDTITFIEWPEKGKGLHLKPSYTLVFVASNKFYTITLLPQRARLPQPS